MSQKKPLLIYLPGSEQGKLKGKATNELVMNARSILIFLSLSHQPEYDDSIYR